MQTSGILREYRSRRHFISNHEKARIAARKAARKAARPLCKHPKCLICGILVGPSHVEPTLLDGLCSTCYRHAPGLASDGNEWISARVDRRESSPAANGTGRRHADSVDG
jgi:hypothetical protein